MPADYIKSSGMVIELTVTGRDCKQMKRERCGVEKKSLYTYGKI